MKQWTTISFLFFFIREIIKWQSLFIYRNLLHHRKNDIREYIVFFFFFLIKSRKSSTQLCAFFYHSTVVLMQLTLPVFMGYIDYWETSRIFCRHRTSIFFAFLLTCLGKLRINYQLNINWNEIFNSWFMYYVILDL